ncbi:MAG: T9SS type A sorting domain-containing protein [Calditrichaeota bacterium]|nr:T9SS type A sorting domain-containing protein [Calditrichota bacterium]
MRKAIIFVLAGIIGLGLSMPVAAEEYPTAVISPGLDEIAYDEVEELIGQPAGPQRDPLGADWIIYDDGNPRSLWPVANLYSRVRFTPNARFRLQGIRFAPLNQQDNGSPCNVYVYRENQQNMNLTDRVFNFRYDRLPAWDPNSMANNWREIVFAENQYVTFEAGESFSIMYGPAPGGPYPGQAGSGWWNVFDGAGVGRSFRVAAVNNEPVLVHANWLANGDGDFLIRANGSYMGGFVDLGVEEVFNGDPNRLTTGTWMMYPNTPQRFKAQIINYGDNVDMYIVNFDALNSDNQATRIAEVVVERRIARGDTVVIECPENWSVRTTGNYRIFAEVQAPDDSNADNNIAGVDQIVFDPRNEPDAWLGYVDNELEGGSNWNEQSGWAATFYHPGVDTALQVAGFRVGVTPSRAQVYQLEMALYLLDVAGLRFNLIWGGNVPTSGQDGDQWVEVPDLPDTLFFRAGEAIIACYHYRNEVAIQNDNTAPIAGTNRHMPWAMLTTGDDGSRFGPNWTGDFAIQIQAPISDRPSPGAWLRTEPDTLLDFGWNLETNQDYIRELLFISYGADSVYITRTTISQAMADYFSVDPMTFGLGSLDTQVVRVTFHSPVQNSYSTSFLIRNTSRNIPSKILRVFAATLPNRVIEHSRPGAPSEWSLAQNHPNPFNPTTTVDFAMLKAGAADISIYDMAGRLIKEAYNGHLSAGFHSLEIDASDLPAGVYMYKLTADGFSSAKKMVLMK